jgi:hypothetical protein
VRRSCLPLAAAAAACGCGGGDDGLIERSIGWNAAVVQGREVVVGHFHSGSAEVRRARVRFQGEDVVIRLVARMPRTYVTADREFSCYRMRIPTRRSFRQALTEFVAVPGAPPSADVREARETLPAAIRAGECAALPVAMERERSS